MISEDETGRNGKFVFGKLKPDKYTLNIYAKKMVITSQKKLI